MDDRAAVNRGAETKIKPKRRIYLAGPMTGRKWFNVSAFDDAKATLASRWNVVSPADIDRAHGFDAMDLPDDTDWNDVQGLGFNLRTIARRDVLAILECDAIYMLSGWQQSRGARAEHALAVWCGLDIFTEEDGP